MPPPTIRLAALLALGAGGVAFAQLGDTCEAQRLVSPPAVGTDDFGLDVETNGFQWFVGSPDARTLCAGSALSCSSGAVFVYSDIAGQLVHTQTIVPPDVALYDKFGISLDVDGNRLVVGSLYSLHPTSGDRTGAAFIYEYDGSQWVEVDRIWPPASVPSEFAMEVTLHGDTLIVTTQRGRSAEVYTWEDASAWRHVQTVTQPDPTGPSIGFGVQWATFGDWFIAGGYLDRRMFPAGGALFCYRRDADGRLELVQEILADENSWLGFTLDFVGETLVVGAPVASRDAPNQGAVRFYEFDGERWTLDDELTQTDPRENRWFGSTVRAQDSRLFVSAFNEYTSVSRGMVYEFERDAGGEWIEVGRFVPDSAHYAGHYGTALASDGEHLLVGASQDESASGGLVGGAYFFDLACGDCAPDLDADGTLTIFDFLGFQNLFDAGDAAADFDGDGELTIFDFLAFQTAFDAGCP